ncbi:hypothetical protein AB5I41_07820 [Sphingomonas sp. MMS24-JH45]
MTKRWLSLFDALAYFALASCALTLTRYDGGIAFIWIATAFLIARLSWTAPKRWPARIALCAATGAVATGVFGLGWEAAPALAVADVSPRSCCADGRAGRHRSNRWDG